MLFLLLLSLLMLTAGISLWLRYTPLAGTTLKEIYALVIALVTTSVLFDVSLVAHLPYWSFIIGSLTSGILLSSYWALKPDFSLSDFSQRIPALRMSYYGAVVLGLLYYLSSMFIPHSGRWGRWDARAIWTLHALFLTDAQHWIDQFSPIIAWSHSDYPLMLSSLIAMFWRATGVIDPVIPCILAYLILIAVLLIVSSALRKRNGELWGVVGLLAFIPIGTYVKIAAFQGADSLLSLFILMPLVLVRLNDKYDEPKLIFLTALMAGFAGWVKNEGIVFTIIFSIAMIWKYRRQRSLIASYLYGLTLPLAVIIAYKVCYAPANDIVSGQNHINSLMRLTDLSRYKLTSHFFLDNMLHLYPVFIGAILLIVLRGYKRLWDRQLWILLLMLVVYYFTFIITPRDLRWHLETASERLFMQLFPAFVYVLLSLAGRDAPQRKSTVNNLSRS